MENVDYLPAVVPIFGRLVVALESSHLANRFRPVYVRLVAAPLQQHMEMENKPPRGVDAGHVVSVLHTLAALQVYDP